MPVHLIVIGAAAAFLLTTNAHWGFRLLSAILIGHSYGCLMYLAHEILHGSVVKNSRLQSWLSGLCMLPYCIGPEHWRAWHNRLHHCHTSKSGQDPDSFGNIAMQRQTSFARFVAKLAPGSGYRRSWLFMGYWFSSHALVTLFVHSKLYNYWPPQQRRRQIALFVAMAGFWGAVLTLVGPYHFAFLYVLPMVVANCVQMSYIATNHLFCDETEAQNDPLANSLTVSTPRWINWLHLDFGYHVEHHIFPYVNSKHAPRIQAALKERFGTHYHEMPITRAWRVLYQTPPVHLSRKELVDLRDGTVYSTLGTQGELPKVIDQVSVPVRPRKRTVEEKKAQAKSLPPSATDQAPRKKVA